MSTARPKTPAAQLAISLSQQVDKEERSLRHLSDDVIMNQMYTKHNDDDTIKIDVNNYILFIESVIKTADEIALALHGVRIFHMLSPFLIPKFLLVLFYANLYDHFRHKEAKGILYFQMIPPNFPPQLIHQFAPFMKFQERFNFH